MGESIKKKYPLLFKDKDTDIEARYKKAWQEARKAAAILKKDFGAERVWVFGSLTDKSRFHKRSDIDLAEVGIPAKRFYAAVAAVTRSIKDYKVDLVDLTDCREAVKKAVEKEGILL
jgi:predicted nucleotidyltransferase